MKKLILVFISFTFWFKVQAQWVNLTTPYVGNINNLAVSGTTLFAANNRGLFYSNDWGVHWTAIDISSNASSIGGILLSGSRLIAGYYGGILTYSYNGIQWTRDTSTTSVTGYFGTFARNGTNLFVSTTDPFADGRGGLFRSTDDGSSWTKIYPTAVHAITVSGQYLLAATFGAFIRSTDNGDNWTSVSISIENFALSFYNIGPKIYALTGSDYIYVSTNDGTTWSPDTTTPFMRGAEVASLPNGAGGMDYFIGNSSGVFLTTDEGMTWNAVNTGLTNTAVKSLIGISGDKIFAGTSGELFTSTNHGATWKQVNSGIGKYSILSLLNEGTKLIAGSDGGGAYYSNDSGYTWKKINLVPDNSSITCFLKKGPDIFAGTKEDGIFHSTDSGKSWNAINSGLTNYYITSLAANETYLFAGTYNEGIFRSSNNGTMWELINQGLTDIYISSLLVNGNNIYMGEMFDGVYRSTDNGATWSRSNSGLFNTQITSFDYDGVNLFAGTRGGYVFRSTDNGTSWTEYNSRLTNTSVTCLHSNNSNLFVGTDVGVFRLKNNGVTKLYTDSGKVSGTLSLAIFNSYLFAGTRNGIWRSPLSELTGIEKHFNNISLNNKLLQNYPNPFNPITNIEYRLAKPGLVTLKVYDVLGREVAILVNGEKTAGTYKVNFNAAGLSSGIYFYRLKVDDFIETKKLVILK